MSTEFVGTDVGTVMDRGQVFPRRGVPEVLLRIPTSTSSTAVGRVTSLSSDGNPYVVLPQAWVGGKNQFFGTTDSWDDSWVISLIKKGP
jgi:hypothetical protein